MINDKVYRAYTQKLYYEKNKVHLSQKAREWRMANPEAVHKNKVLYRERNREKLRAKGREYARQFRKKNPEYNNFKQREYRFKLRLEVLSHYGGTPPSCICCGEQLLSFLTLDHINNDGKEHRKQMGVWGGSATYKWLKQHGYPDNIQVLCMNCNFSKAHNKEHICEHKRIT
jgi:hypothetical protein